MTFIVRTFKMLLSDIYKIILRVYRAQINLLTYSLFRQIICYIQW